MFTVQGSEEVANGGTGQMSAVGCGVVCCSSGLCDATLGRGCFPALGPQQFDKPVGFSMESPIPEDTPEKNHWGRARTGDTVKEKCQGGDWLQQG